MSKQLQNIRHDYIRYANCWEDADVLLEGLQIKPGDKVLSIGSAGDNSFSLLVGDPDLVVAVDINVVQLKLIELKKAAIKALDHHEFLEFIGFTDSLKRLDLFEKVKMHLTPELTAFWSGRSEEIKNGIIHQGKFERYFQLFHTRILPKIHTVERIKLLFDIKNEQEQAHFFQKKWNNLRWRLLFRIFFSRFVLGRFGRDPKFLNEVKVSVSTFILERAARHLSLVDCQNNYFLRYILTGEFGHYLPHYARRENYEIIKQRIDRIITFEGLAEKAFEKYPLFDKFNLSNIFEYMDAETFKAVTDNLIAHANPNARIAYWNLMVERKISSISGQVKCDETLSSKLHNHDKGFFYGGFFVDVKE